MDIHHDPAQEKVEENAVQHLNEILVQHSATPVLLLLSGGSALQLVDNIDVAALSENTVISVLDERIGSDDNSNFYQLLQTSFYRDAKDQGARFFDVRAKEGEDEKDVALRLQKMFRMLLTMMPTCTIITTMGIGSDGHTAGIMPYPEDETFFFTTFDQKENWIVGYNAGEKNKYPRRVSVSLSFLRDYIDYAVVYACGQEKRDALQAMVATEGNIAATPARIIREMKSVDLFTDVDDVVV